MKIKYVLPLASLILLLFGSACHKSDPGEQQVPLSGVAFYTSPLFENDTITLKMQEVQAVDSLNGAIYPLLTDTMGRFFLPGWPGDQVFRLQTTLVKNDSDEYNVVYNARAIVRGEQLKSAVILATIDTLKFKTLLLAVKDSFAGRIAEARLFVYTSRVIATADTGFVGYSAMAAMSTNNHGRCLLMQLPSDSLFIKSRYVADTVLTLKSEILALKLEHNFTDTSITVR